MVGIYFDVLMGDEININDFLTSPTLDARGNTTYAVCEEYDLGYVYLSEGKTSLTLRNETNNAVYVDCLMLEYVSADDLTNTTFTFELSASEDSVVLSSGNSYKQVISDVKKGKYLVKINAATTDEVKLKIATFDGDTGEVVSIAATNPDSRFSIFDDFVLGYINIDENTEYIKLESLSGTVHLSDLTIERMAISYEVKFYSDEIKNELITSVNDVCKNIKNAKAYANIKIKNNAAEEGMNFYIVAVTYKDGAIISISKSENKENILYLDELDTIIPLELEQGCTAKVFIWSDLADMMPLFDTKILYSGINTEYYVSAQNGNDANDGSYNAPFATIERAKEQVRQMNNNMSGDIIVHLDGAFELGQTLNFSEDDSGSNGFNVIYDGDESAIISGGKQVSDWKQVENTPLWKATVNDADGFRHLYVNGNRAVRARSEYFYYAKDFYDDTGISTLINSNYDGVILEGDDFPADFSIPRGVECIWNPSWRSVIMPVRTAFRNEDGDYVLRFKQPYFDMAFNESSPITLEHPLYFENAPEYLDMPGEWYFNKSTGELFYYPLTNEDMTGAEVYIPELETLVDVSGENADNKVKNLCFTGINFMYGAWEDTSNYGFSNLQSETYYTTTDDTEGMGGSTTAYATKTIPAQFKINHGENIVLERNEFSHMGSSAVSINNSSDYCTVSGNIFDDISASAVRVGDAFINTHSQLWKYCKNLEISNNLIRRSSVEYNVPVISVTYMNNSIISHNDILDTPYSGISIGWGWGRNTLYNTDNEISYNKIENANYKAKDGSHIYTLDSQKGTIIKGNYMIKSNEWKGGIYHDNSSAYILSTENVFEDINGWMKITWNNIHSNIARNNYSDGVMYNTYPAQNDIDEAIGKTDGKWDDKALAIIENAGLSDNYNDIYSTYNEKSVGYTNPELDNPPRYVRAGGTIINGADLTYGWLGERCKHRPLPEYTGTRNIFTMVNNSSGWVTYTVNLDKSGEYKLYSEMSSNTTYPKVNIYIDDVLTLSNVAIKDTDLCTSSENTWYENYLGEVTLSSGAHEIKIEMVNTGANIRYLRIAESAEDELYTFTDGFCDNILAAIIRG